ncbi:hypothetical protein J5N97_010106 [Dioscorea zingiberensis]|uniref:GH10 domain-containing protein n=1 Tax=Dioscorea zingiberensis TaxID=325984 RepID=A0A9D5CYF7_9LILI|nr:hypothetical protein J5N97_010106 [Dioscorea zingiberensis]
MRRWASSLIHKGRRSSGKADSQPETQAAGDSMAEPQRNDQYTDGYAMVVEIGEQSTSHASNIILNHDFSGGLDSWHPNSCHAYVASREAGLLKGITANSVGCYAVVTKRTQSWQGLEQEITGKVSVCSTYTVSAFVRVHGDLQQPTVVQATLKLEYSDSPTSYLFVGSASVSEESWVRLEGSFSLPKLPKRIVFYLEGPPPGVDLLIDSVIVSSSSMKQIEEVTERCAYEEDDSIIKNPHFENGLNHWTGRGCKLVLRDSLEHGGVCPLNGKFFVVASHRSQTWNGIQQDITGKVKRKVAYEVTAIVRIDGADTNADVRATLWVQAPNGREQYIGIANLQASNKEWVQLRGKFLLNGVASKAVLYLEGPPSGVDILVDSLVLKRAKKVLPSNPPDIEGSRVQMVGSLRTINKNIIDNYDFSEGLRSWTPNCCNGYVVSGALNLFEGITPKTGQNYAVIRNRKESWQGLEQDITKKVSSGFTYSVSATVRVWGPYQESSTVLATLKLTNSDSSISYLQVGRALVSKDRWETLEGSFTLKSIPKQVVFFLEGPSPGLDILIDSVEVSCNKLKLHQNVLHGVNIIENSTFNDGLKKWSPLGSCTLSIHTGSPRLLPPLARESLGDQQPLSGLYVRATNRSETWMGPSQTVTDKLKLHLTYQVAAWVRVGSAVCGPQNINVALNVDNSWVNGGQVEVEDNEWHEIAGSFRVEKQPSKVVIYLQGPSPGVDLMLAGLHMFPVDRKARFDHLKEQTDKVRKRDIILKFAKSDVGLHGSPVIIRQTENSFPFGSCLNRSNIENEEFVDFFLKNFNWAVFGNELKWYHTEPQQGKFNYHDADEMLEFCERHDINVRGHCIFWEVEDIVQPWVKSLDRNNLMIAVQNRLKGLLSRYKGRFKHYDVNNEMLHGSFYQDRLGKDIRAYMFRESHQLDPTATLFVNDYNVEDGRDGKSTPEMYIQQILDLQERGAPVGGIGIQGHIDHPVGPIICSALDKLAILGLPIWFTELDVAAANEHIRADDLEIMLREAYAHPAVEGIVLWGFWEFFMCRDHSHLVDAEGDVNEAGKRYLALKQEWLSHADGHIDTHGEYKFRGYQGKYTVEINTPAKKFSRSFIVDKGDSPLVLNINL